MTLDCDDARGHKMNVNNMPVRHRTVIKANITSVRAGYIFYIRNAVKCYADQSDHIQFMFHVYSIIVAIVIRLSYNELA